MTQAALQVGILGPIPTRSRKLIAEIERAVRFALEKHPLPETLFLGIEFEHQDLLPKENRGIPGNE